MLENNENIIAKELGKVYRQIQILIESKLDPFDFGRGQYLYFIHILKSPGINQETLSSILKIDKGSTARAVKKLCDTGYIVRKRCVEDRRAWRLFPSEKALEIFPEFAENMRSINEMLLENFSEDEKETIFYLLKKLSKNIENVHSDMIENK